MLTGNHLKLVPTAIQCNGCVYVWVCMVLDGSYVYNSMNALNATEQRIKVLFEAAVTELSRYTPAYCVIVNYTLHIHHKHHHLTPIYVFARDSLSSQHWLLFSLLLSPSPSSSPATFTNSSDN